MSEIKLAVEIAERLCNKLYPAGDYWRVDEFTEIISSALEARERDVQELCEAAEDAHMWAARYPPYRDETSKDWNSSPVCDRLRTALAKLRAGEQKGTE